MTQSLFTKAELDTEMTVVRNEFESRREQPVPACCGSGCRRSPSTGTTTATCRSARAPTSRTCRSRTCARSTSGTTSPTTRCSSSPASSTRRRRSTSSRSTSARSRSRPARCRRCTRPNRCRTASAWSRCAVPAAMQLVAALYRIPQGAHPDFLALKALARIMTIQPSGRLYQALVDTKKATEVDASVLDLHDPGTLVFWVQVPAGRLARRRAGRAAGDGRRDRRRADHRRRGRPRPHPGAEGLRRHHQRSAAARRRAVRVDRRRRLAAVLPAAGPLAHAEGRRRAARGEDVAQTREPDDRPLRPRRAARPHAGRDGGRRRGAVQGLPRRRRGRRRRDLRRDAGQPRSADPAGHAPGRHEARAAAEAEPRRDGALQPAPAPRRLRVARRHRALRLADRGAAVERHPEARPAGVQRRGRPPARQARLRRRRRVGRGKRRDGAGESRAGAAARGRGAAHPGVPRRRVRQADPRADRERSRRRASIRRRWPSAPPNATPPRTRRATSVTSAASTTSWPSCAAPGSRASRHSTPGSTAPSRPSWRSSATSTPTRWSGSPPNSSATGRAARPTRGCRIPTSRPWRATRSSRRRTRPMRA